MEKKVVTKRQLERYPVYLKYLTYLKGNGTKTISSCTIAEAMGSSEEQVRKDFQAISTLPGRPGKGRSIDSMIEDLRSFLGYNSIENVVLIGAGHLGSALLKFPGMDKYGIQIIAAFDKNDQIIGKPIGNIMVYPLSEMKTIIEKNKVKLAIVSVNEEYAQETADNLFNSGIKGILNFAPCHINYDESNYSITNVDFASSLSILAHQVNSKFN